MSRDACVFPPALMFRRRTAEGPAGASRGRMPHSPTFFQSQVADAIRLRAMILVTGATRTVGSHVAGELARAHVPARALIRSPHRGPGLPDGIELVVGDL